MNGSPTWTCQLLLLAPKWQRHSNRLVLIGSALSRSVVSLSRSVEVCRAVELSSLTALTPRHMQSGRRGSVEVCRELSSSCRAILSSYCRVTVEFNRGQGSSEKCTTTRLKGSSPPAKVSSVIGEFIFDCVRQILWARLMRWIVVRDRGVVYRIAKYTLPYRRQSGRRYRAL